MDETKCQCVIHERGSKWNTHMCNKPIKGKLKDGTPACGWHIGAEKRLAKKDADYEKEMDLWEKKSKEVRKIAKQNGLNAYLRWGGEVVAMSYSEFMKITGNQRKE